MRLVKLSGYVDSQVSPLTELCRAPSSSPCAARLSMADLSLVGRLMKLRPLLIRAVSVGPERDRVIDWNEYETMMRDFNELTEGVSLLEMQERKRATIVVR